MSSVRKKLRKKNKKSNLENSVEVKKTLKCKQQLREGPNISDVSRILFGLCNFFFLGWDILGFQIL